MRVASDRFFQDVSAWFVVQMIFMMGFASGMYALSGDPETAYASVTPAGTPFNWTIDQSCEMLSIGQPEDACVVENDACADDDKSSLLDALFAAPSLDDLDDEEPPPLV